MKRKNNVWIGILAAAAVLTAACPAFAQVQETEAVLTAQEDVVNTGSAESAATASHDPLTPAGNLTLVDDASDGKGKQFITMVSKSGNYFYLVIDRDKNGNENVHFLNLVDEADLLALMEEEEAEAYIDNKKEKETEAYVPPAETEPQEPPAAAQTQTRAVPSFRLNLAGLDRRRLRLVGLFLLGMAGIGGIAALKKRGGKKKKEKNGQDPDADYQEEEAGSDFGPVPGYGG